MSRGLRIVAESGYFLSDRLRSGTGGRTWHTRAPCENRPA